MSIFTRIKDAIFGKQAAAQSSAPPASSSGRTPTASSGTAPAQAKPAQSSSQPAVDVEAVLEKMAAGNAQKLNWRTSIVDLMKWVGMDSSVENRKELARELGVDALRSDSLISIRCSVVGAARGFH